MTRTKGEKPHEVIDERHEVSVIRIHETPTSETSDSELAKIELGQTKETAGWKRIVKYYKEKMDILEKTMWTEGKSKTREEIISIIDRRNMCTQFINIPEILIGGIDLKIETVEPNLDPYPLPKSYDQVVKETFSGK